MTRAKRRGIRRWWPAAGAAIVATAALSIAGYVHASSTSKDAAEALCLQVVQDESPGSTLEITSTTRIARTQYSVTITAVPAEGGRTEFSCLANPTSQGGWAVLAGGEERPR